MSQQPFIRVATPGDADELAALARRTFHDAFAADNSATDMEAYMQEAFGTDRIRLELGDSSNTFFLAYAGSRAHPTGYAKLRAGPADPNVRGPDPVELERLYVEQTAIGQGLGAALMQTVLDAARSHGYRTLWLGVSEWNTRALTFYLKWRFEVVGDHIFRLGSDDQTDLIMERSTDDPVGR